MATMTEIVRIQHIKRELATQSADAEKHSIPWKDSRTLCPIVTLATDAVVLNPHSHRLRAQLASHSKREELEEDPFGFSSQEVLAELIRDDETFDDLKANLKEEGQHNPGVVTRAGLLVNGNRRAVALSDLGQPYIRVAVLPPHATERDIAELELKLQMTREFKQDYTFTNQLLFVEELHDHYEYPLDRIALMLRYAQSSSDQHLKSGVAKVQQAIRMLALIREIQDISGARISYQIFDDQQVSLQELDKSYEKLIRDDAQAAQRLRTTRYIGLILASGYKVLRQMDTEFFEEYLLPAIEDNETLQRYVRLDEILLADNDNEEDDLNLALLSSTEDVDVTAADPEKFVRWMATLDAYVPALQAGDARIKGSREMVWGSVRKSLEDAAEQAKLDKKKEREVDAPLNRLKEATDKVRRANAQLDTAIQDPGFNLNNFKYRMTKLGKAVRNLAAKFESLKE